MRSGRRPPDTTTLQERNPSNLPRARGTLTCTLAPGRGGPVQLQAARASEYLQHRISADRIAELKFKGVWGPSRLPARSPATGQELGAELTGTPTFRPAIILKQCGYHGNNISSRESSLVSGSLPPEGKVLSIST